jgi:ubiquinone biosynthesis protein UbiJ
MSDEEIKKLLLDPEQMNKQIEALTKRLERLNKDYSE